jgi:hypothetical protein
MATEEDLAAARTIVDRQTPAHVDRENAHASAWHDDGYKTALARAASVSDYAGWHAVLSAYLNGFGDPHLKFSAKKGLPAGKWPGFVISDDGSGPRVAYRAGAAAPPLGAQLMECDGEGVQALTEKKVFSHALNARLAVDRRRAASRLFLDRGVPFAPPVVACVFEPGGSVKLEWRDAPPTDDPMWAAYREAGLGPEAKPGLSQPAEGVVWIGAPGFLPVGDDNKNMSALLKEIGANQSALASARAIVIDVRGNSGGSSAWGDRLAKAIWGETIVAQYALDDSAEATDWRASKENASYVRLGATLLSFRFPGSGVGKEWGSVIAPGIDKAVKEGRPFFREGSPTPGKGGGAALARPKGESPIEPTVYFLTNGACASACLDFADVVLHIPGVVHIGSETSGDGLMMEVRSIKLPSGRGSITAPIKVVRGRPRGDLEVYEPDMRYQGPWTEEAVRTWTLSVIDAESPAQ